MRGPLRKSPMSTGFALAGVLGASMFGCSSAPPSGDARSASGGSPAALAGKVTMDGSSTVFAVSQKMAEAFRAPNPGVSVTVKQSGSAEGFKRLCAGEVDMADASRPINAAETADCAKNHVEFIELPIGFDGVTVVVNPKNSFVGCLTLSELRTMWEPKAEGRITRWNQVRASFPDRPLALYAPGTASGTFDYFTLAVVGTEHSSRGDYNKNEDHNVVAEGVAGNPDAVGYLGQAYYRANREKLKLVAVDGGKGCVLPSLDTVLDNSYQPLSRPLFVYVSKAAAARPEVKALGDFFTAPENSTIVQDVGYVPLPTATSLTVARRLDNNVTGSIFGGKGSVLGVTADVFKEDERVKSALVQ